MCVGDAALCQVTLTSWLLFQRHFSAISHRGFPTELQYSNILISLKCPQNSEQQNPQNFTNFRAGCHSAMQRYITKSKENTYVKQWFCIAIRFRSGGPRTKIRRRTTYYSLDSESMRRMTTTCDGCRQLVSATAPTVVVLLHFHQPHSAWPRIWNIRRCL